LHNLINGNAELINEEDSLELLFGDISKVIEDKAHPEFKHVNEVLLHLTLCHTVIVDISKNEYSASSPDELALVEGAKMLGYEFISKNEDQIVEV
jgi:magnesium-transporting ATPase (P-type)